MSPGVAPAVAGLQAARAGDLEDSGRDAPVTARGRRTREALLRAARDVFERDGYFDAKITDMTAGAGVSSGTFYTYFDSKEEIFRDVALLVQQDMTWAGDPRHDDDDLDPVRRIERANRAYLEAYRRNAGFMRTLEQVLAFNSDITGVAGPRREAFAPRIERSIRGMQDDGLVPHDFDPVEAGLALMAMVSRYAFWLYVSPGKHAVEMDDAVYTTTLLWARAVGLDVTDLVARRGAQRALKPAANGRRRASRAR